MTKILPILLFILIIFSSCEEEPDPCNTQSSNFRTEIATTDTHLNNTLYFSSPEQMQTTIANLKNMNREERRKWEKKNNFTSYKTVLEDIYSKIAKLDEDSYEDEIEFYDIIENNSDVLEIRDEAIVEKIENETYQLISNRLGIFF